MTLTQIAGGCILAGVFLVLFGMTVSVAGAKVATMVWVFSIAVTAVIVVSVAMITKTI